MNKKLVKLNTIAKKIRKKVFETIAYAGKGHIGGAMSCIDILVALYFGNNLKINPKKPKLDNRDRFIFSKGHASIALYVVLEKFGFINSSMRNNFQNVSNWLSRFQNIAYFQNVLNFRTKVTFKLMLTLASMVTDMCICLELFTILRVAWRTI